MSITIKLSPFTSGAAIILGALAASAGTPAPTYTVEAIAVHGLPASGTSEGVSFQSPSVGLINDVGEVLFYSRLSGSGVNTTSDEGLWRGAPGNLSLIAREGTQAHDVPAGINYTGPSAANPAFRWHSAASGGSACFIGRLAGPGVNSSNDLGLWSIIDGTPTLVARESDFVPGLTGVRLAVFHPSLQNLPVNNSGLCLFAVALTGTGVNSSNDEAILAGEPGNVRIAIRKGDVEPGTSAIWRRWSVSGSVSGQVNDQGILDDSGSFAILAETEISSQTRWGIWLGTIGNPTTFTPVAGAGEPVPGVPDAVFLTSSSASDIFLDPSISPTGRIGFVGRFSGPGVTPSTNRGVWVGTPGNLQLVARAGDTWIGASEHETFGTAFFTPTHLPDGRTVFRGSIAGSAVTPADNTGIWIADDKGLHLIAREGQQIPGEAPGVLVGDLAPHQNGSRALVANGAGQVVFESFTGRVLVWNAHHGLFAVLPAGHTVEVAPGDVRTLQFAGSIDNGSPILNEAGQFVAAANLGGTQPTILRVSLTPPPPPLCADANGDNVVNAADLSVLLAQFGTSVLPGTDADFNGDGVVDAADLSVLLSNFGESC